MALDSAISWSRTQDPPRRRDWHERAHTTSQTALLYRKRFELTGDRRDLDTSIDLCRRCVAAVPANHATRPSYQANLGIALADRALLDPDPLLGLGEAIDVLSEASTQAHRIGTPTKYVDNSLAQLLTERFDRSRVRSDVDRAVGLNRRAVHEAGPDERARLRFAANFIAVLGRRFREYGDSADLDEALAVGREAIESLSADDPAYAQVAINLAHVLMLGYRRVDRSVPAATDTAAEYLRQTEEILQRARNARAGSIAGCYTSTSLARVRGELGQWDDALSFYREAIQLLPAVATRRLPVGSRVAQLATFDGLAREATSVALWAAQTTTDPQTARLRLQEAVTLLDHGRGVIAGMALDPRADLARLRHAHPALAHELELVSSAISYDKLTDPDQQRRLSDDFDRLLAAIRTKPGFADFHQPPAFSSLVQAAARGAVVMINVSQASCDAMVLRPDGDIEVVRLPKVIQPTVIDWADRWAATVEGGPEGHTTVEEILGGLRRDIMEPIVTRLTACDLAAPGSHVWLIPTGALTTLPLHAAMIDLDLVFSYSTTVSALARGVGRTTVTWDRASTLGVGVAQTADGEVLPGAEREAGYAAAAPLLGRAATSENVRERLRSTPYAHLACHARCDPWDPTAGALMLYDGPLKFTDITIGSAVAGHAVVLSGCATALSSGRARTTDEPLSLAAAFQSVGLTHVVGTLWPIPDQVAVRTVAAYYASLSEQQDIAVAVHEAMKQAYRRYPTEPRAWAAYVHFGP